MAIKLHFTKDNFNVFENKGHVKCSMDTFINRNDRYLFEKIANKYPIDRDLIQMYVASMAYGNESVVYCAEEAERCLFEWNKRKQSMTRLFIDDLDIISEDAIKYKLTKPEILEFSNDKYPSIFNLYIGKHISLETVSIINDFENMISGWKQKKTILTLWEDEIRRIEKSNGFIKYNKEKITSIYNEFKNNLLAIT